MKRKNKIHFVGIKGVAMAALAVWYKEAGFAVTGSDVSEEFPTDEVLAISKINVLTFDPKNISNIRPDLVIYTGAHNGRDNDEVVEAIAQGIPVMPHAQALGEVMKGKKQISVAGSHGKTTTTAMIATILAHAGRDPSWAVGCGEIKGLGLPGHFGKDKIFVAEADEYVTDPGHDATPRFMWQHPDVLVVTNIDFDHPDVYRSLDEVKVAFEEFEKQANIVVRSEDFEISRVRSGKERTFFTLDVGGMTVGDFTLKVPGRHNAQNAGAAAVAASHLGLSWDSISKGLTSFGGTKRRFELVGTFGDAQIIDDYAHHPKEIRATLEAASQWYPEGRIIAVFQPHTYSRTKSLLTDFSQAFGKAHEVILTEIYQSARETDTLGISGKSLVEETAKHHPRVWYAPDFTAVKKMLHGYTNANDIIIFMGAGSIYTWAHEFAKLNQ